MITIRKIVSTSKSSPICGIDHCGNKADYEWDGYDYLCEDCAIEELKDQKTMAEAILGLAPILEEKVVD